MKWSTIWELTKINILYSNPQTLTAIKKKKEKNPDKSFSAYKSMFKQQGMLILLFTVIYSYMFVGMDFRTYPGYFSFYVATFFLMATISAFSSMYTIFYESNDVKLYVYLPVKPSELYVAKILSSLGMGTVFLMPILSLLFVANWQLFGPILAIPLTLLIFLVVLVSSMVLSLYLNSLIGKIIVRSPRRKLISTALIFISTFGAIVPILYLNTINQTDNLSGAILGDRMQVPYFRGFHDVMVSPISMASLLNFWLPLVIVVIMIFGIVKHIMPSYYQEALYTNAKTANSVKKKNKASNTKDGSLKSLLIRHHLSTLQNATLLTQTYLMPIIYVIIFVTPMLSSGADFSKIITSDYFGVTFLVGFILGIMCSTPTSFVGVGISLERENLTFFKALPLNFKKFLVQKFFVLFSLQVVIPALVYFILGLFLLKLPLLVVFSFIIGLIVATFLQGQAMYRRDYKLLDLKWQDMTQLFSRGSGQWFAFGIMMGSLFVGGVLAVATIVLGNITGEMLLYNIFLMIILCLVAAIFQLFLYRGFWKKLS